MKQSTCSLVFLLHDCIPMFSCKLQVFMSYLNYNLEENESNFYMNIACEIVMLKESNACYSG